jgi:hypothetical protein
MLTNRLSHGAAATRVDATPRRRRRCCYRPSSMRDGTITLSDLAGSTCSAWIATDAADMVVRWRRSRNLDALPSSTRAA